MSKLLKTLEQYPDATQASDSATFNALALVNRQQQYVQACQSGEFSFEALHWDDLRLAGTLMSTVLECELLSFLQSCRERGIKNYRNGYLQRSIATPEGELHCVVSRDRLGLFDPVLLHSYARESQIDTADILALGVASGYNEEETRTLLEGIYASEGGIPKTLQAMSDALLYSCRAWSNAALPSWTPLVIGWTRVVHHQNGMEKRIIGLKTVGPDGKPLGLRAVAGSEEEAYSLTDNFMKEVALRGGLINPSYFAFPAEFEPFADAAKRYWSYSKLLPVARAHA